MLTRDQLIPPDLMAKLLENSRRSRADEEFEAAPVVKLFWGPYTWLLTDVDPENQDRAFGLCDLGQGEPELGYVLISEILESIPLIERDLYTVLDKPISHYAEKARLAGRIVT